MRKALLTFIAIPAVLALGACSGGGSAESSDGASGSSASGSGGTLTLGTSVAPGPWDLKDAPLGAAYQQYFQPVYDSLILLDDDGEPTAGLATDWSWDDTQTVLTMTLRDGVTFTDGAPFDASAVEANLENTQSGASEAAGALAGVSGVEVVDESTVAITLAAPDPSLVTNLGQTPGMMASPASIADGSIATAPVGTGPYVLADQGTTEGSQYTFTRNPDYWDADAYPYDTVVYKVLTDQTARENALRAGEIDVAEVSPANAESLEGSGLTVTLSGSGDIEGIFLFDRAGTMCEPLADVQVRRAINHAVDRETIVEQLQAGNGTITEQIFVPSSQAYDTSLEGTYPYDPEKAKELLAEAGYPDGFTCDAPDFSGFYPQAAAAVTQYLGAVGITLNPVQVAPNELIGKMLGGEFPLSYFRLASHRPWEVVTTIVGPTANWNPMHYEDPTVTDLISQIQVSTGADQEALYQELNAYLVDQAWFAPWDEPMIAQGMSPDVTITNQRYMAVAPLRNFAPTN